MEAQNQFGAALKRLREARGLTQEQLAERAGLTRNAIAALERGRRLRPYPYTLQALSEALKLSNPERDALVASVHGPQPASAAPSTAFIDLLPGTFTPLLGRERDVAFIQALLERDETRLITLTGPGGVGKTRLAAGLASRMGNAGGDGVPFVALASLTDPGLIIPTIAQTLGLREEGAIRDVLHAHLRHKRMLLVLDNFEHLLAGAPMVSALLAACPSLKVLATSRIPLGVRGEQEYVVEPLASPDPARALTFETVRTAPAVTLFVNRAQAVNAAFVLSERNAATVAAICWRLDGLPLAIELAAARARLLSVTEILARLDQVLQTGSARYLPERQRTMRATLDWSHNLLSERERVLFRRLAVFAGGFTLTAAEMVATADIVGTADVLDLLDRLVEQSLVSATADEDQARYGMLEPIRQYALDHLAASGEAEHVRAHHATFYRNLAEAAGVALRGGEQGTWLKRIQREYSNLRTALAWLLDHGGAAQVAEIGWSIWRFWSFRGRASEGLYWMERALDGTHPLTPTARARARAVVGTMELVRGEPERVAVALDASVAAARAAGDEALYAMVLSLRGLAAVSNGDIHGAEAILTEAVATCRQQANQTFVVFALSGLSQLALVQGDSERATTLNAEAEAVARALGDWSMLNAILMCQAMVERMVGNMERATMVLRESIELAVMLDDVWSMVLGATTLAGVAVERGQAPHAARLFAAIDAACATWGLDVSWPLWRAQRSQDEARLRGQLDAQRLAALEVEGRTMPLEQAIAYTLAEA